MTKLFVSGMFRSGTTLMARMLNSHSKISFASDPFAPLFKSFRNSVLSSTYPNFDLDSPFADYYYSQNSSDLMKMIERDELRNRAPKETLFDLKKKIATSTMEYSPLIVEKLDLLTGSDYHEIFKTAFDVVKETYIKDAPEITGFKEVWTNEFALHMLRSFPDLKVIFVTRDPRSVVASNQHSLDGAYPIRFLTRQWRKSVSFLIKALNDETVRDRILSIRYEDLILNPHITIHKIINFLGVKFESNILDVGRFKDGKNLPWKQNSSFTSTPGVFDTKSLDSWKRKLYPNQISYINMMLTPEMKLMNYVENYEHLEVDLQKIEDYADCEPYKLASWIKKYEFIDRHAIKSEIIKDIERNRCLLSKSILDEEKITQMFLNIETYESIRKGLH
jgi:hypothetical protein